jgi:hypothetical protein
MVMAEKKVSGTVHIHVDDINSLRLKTLLAYTSALNYKYSVQSDKDMHDVGRQWESIELFRTKWTE